MSETSALIQKILEKTRGENVSGWNDRISDIAALADIPLHLIDWQGSPSSVAMRLITYSRNNDGLILLAKVAEQY
jgi:hypothetical protein